MCTPIILENKKTFSEAEKDAIIEEILKEKPWEGLFKGKVALFLRKRTLTLYCLITALTMFSISQDINQPHIGWAGFAIAITGFLWDTFITSRSYDLKMTDREWVTLAVKGGYLGDKDLIENKNFFTRNLLLWIPMLGLTGVITYCIYFLNINTNDIWYLCIAFLLCPMFYGTMHFTQKLKSKDSVLNRGYGFYIQSGSIVTFIFTEYKSFILDRLFSYIAFAIGICITIFSIKNIFFLNEIAHFGYFFAFFIMQSFWFMCLRVAFLQFKLGAISNHLRFNYFFKNNL